MLLVFFFIIPVHIMGTPYQILFITTFFGGGGIYHEQTEQFTFKNKPFTGVGDAEFFQ